MGMIKKAVLPPVPSLPVTTLGDTKAPMGVAPVAPAAKPSVVESEKMTKKDWANKDSAIETVAIVKSVLESPAYAQLAVGRNEKEVLEIGSRMFQHFLKEFKEAKNG